MSDLQQRQWKWEENSVLNDIGPYTDTKEIFDAVCKEVGRYYTGKKQFKTYKRKIKWTGDYLNCQFCFWSASWNTTGQSVCFNIVATMYSNDIEDMDRKGIIGDLRYKYRELFNVYNIDTKMFFEIVDYIDEMVEYLKSLDSYDGFKKHMEEFSEHYKIFELESNGQIFLNRINTIPLTMLETDRIRIYPANREQMESSILAEKDDELKKAYGEMLEGCLTHKDQWDWYAMWMIEKIDGTHIGDLCFKGLEEKNPEIGYGILEEFQGHGYATEAVALAIKWAFDHPEIGAVEAETDPDNVASQKVLMKCGFEANGEIGEEGPRFIVKRKHK